MLSEKKSRGSQSPLTPRWGRQQVKAYPLLLSCIMILFILGIIVEPAHAAESASDLAQRLRERGTSPLLIAGLISMIPIFELRGGIPVGIALFRLNAFVVFGTCILFNILPVLPILLLLNPARRLLERIPLLKRMFDFLTRRALKNRELIERYEEFGLTLFVGIPLPVTGAWTGSLIAVVLGLKITKSFLFISLGVFLAGIIVTLISVLGTYGIAAASAIILLYAALYILKLRRGARGS